MLDFSINNIDFKIPESWAELNTENRLRLIPLCGLEPEKQVRQYHEQIWKLFIMLGRPSDMNKKEAAALWENLSIDPSQWYQMQQMISWVYNTTPKTLHEQFIKVDGAKFYFTDPDLECVSAIEIAWLNQAYIAIAESDENTFAPAVNQLIAIVARPLLKPAVLLQKANDPTWNGDRRRPLSHHEIKANIAKVNLIDERYKWLIVQYAIGLIEGFTDEFYELFNQAQGDNTYVQPEFPQGTGFEAHLHRVAKEGTFGDYNKVCQTKARTIWMAEYLAFQIQKAEIENAKIAQKEAKKQT